MVAIFSKWGGAPVCSVGLLPEKKLLKKMKKCYILVIALNKIVLHISYSINKIKGEK